MYSNWIRDLKIYSEKNFMTTKHKLLGLSMSSTLWVHWNKSIVSKPSIETNPYLISCLWNSNAAMFIKSLPERTRKEILLLIQCMTHSVFSNHYHWIHLFCMKNLLLHKFQINWNQSKLVFRKIILSLRKIRLTLNTRRKIISYAAESFKSVLSRRSTFVFSTHWILKLSKSFNNW